MTRLNWASEQEIDDLCTLMNFTVLAPNPYTNPFHFPDSIPTQQPDASGATINPQVLQNLGARADPLPTPNPQQVPEVGGYTINYHALWHPPDTDARVDRTTDRLYSAFMEQVIRDVERMVALKNTCTTIYITARNRGVLHQLSLVRTSRGALLHFPLKRSHY